MNKNILKKFIVSLSLFVFLFGYNFVFAEDVSTLIVIPSEPEILSTSIHLTITSGSSSLYDNYISVTPCDSDNDPVTLDTITAYCAVLQSNILSTWNWAWAPGAFVDSIDNIAGYTSKDTEGNDVYHYWSWSSNDTLGMTGLNQYDLQSNDTISLEFIDPQPEIVTHPEPEIIIPPVSETSRTSGSSGSSILKIENKIFSVSNALDFLLQNQKNDGSFGSPMYTDWVAIAAGAGNNSNLKSSLINYLKSNPLNSSVLTDNERHAMALMSLGINPYLGTNINYIKKITDNFDGTQFGDNTLENDDIFALIVLAKSGYVFSDELIKKDVSYLLSKQSSNGSWGNVDITSAAVEALDNFRGLSGVSDAISKAYDYIISSQSIDGGFGNSSSTSWAIQAMMLDDSMGSEVDKAIKYLSNHQQVDGGLDDTSDVASRVWSTSYVIPAILNLSWNDILEYFDREDLIIHYEDNNLQDEVKEEIPVEQEIQEPAIKKEKIIKPEIPIQVKVKNNIIKKNVIVKKAADDISSDSGTSGNSLLANAINADQNSPTFMSFIGRMISILEAPFVWLWLHLIF